MTDIVRRMTISRNLVTWGIAVAVLLGVAYLGSHATMSWLVLSVGSVAAFFLLQRPVRGLFALIAATLLVRFDISTGTEVRLNLAALLVPALCTIWLLDMIRCRDLHLIPSNANRPLLLLLVVGLLSLLIGTVLWNPAVPRSNNLILVQLAQWAIFAFSAVVFWLVGNLVRDEDELRYLTFVFLALGGSLAILHVLPGGQGLIGRWATSAVYQAPFWLLLVALAGGQLLFNQELSARWRLFLLATLIIALLFALILERQTLSYLVGVVPAVGVLAWLRWPRLRHVFVVLSILCLVAFSPGIYRFLGGDAEWDESGGSRLALIGRVVEVTMRNPITGLGPAAYRAYARMQPLTYGRAYWIEPLINSHNNYVDIFSQMGILGLGLFGWFAMEVVRLGARLRAFVTTGFAAGYVNGMLAAWVGSLVVMLMADWILPFVYNVGFGGFQASVLVWMFLGGLIVLDTTMRRKMPMEAHSAT